MGLEGTLQVLRELKDKQWLHLLYKHKSASKMQSSILLLRLFIFFFYFRQRIPVVFTLTQNNHAKLSLICQHIEQDGQKD